MAVGAALHALGYSYRDASYAAEDAVTSLIRWDAKPIEPDRDLAHEADMRELQREQLRADVGDDEARHIGTARVTYPERNIRDFSEAEMRDAFREVAAGSCTCRDCQIMRDIVDDEELGDE